MQAQKENEEKRRKKSSLDGYSTSNSAMFTECEDSEKAEKAGPNGVLYGSDWQKRPL